MRSVLFHVGPFTVRSYGLLLALSFLLGIWLAGRRARRTAITSEQIVDLSLYLIISSVIGARLFYVFLHWGEFSNDLLGIVNPFQTPGEFGVAGLVFYGGFLFALLTSIWYARWKRLSFWVLADVMSPSIALGLALSRVGCFLNGCCFGKACDLPWAVQFPPDSPAGSLFRVPVHPAQLYESLGALFILGILLVVDRRKPFEGFTFWVFGGLYAVLRFTVDVFRYYDPESSVRVFSHVFSVNQFISAGIFVAACVAFAWPRKRQDRTPPPVATPRPTVPAR
jgi:phosphatidylglycerol:prolipoprotein diacylglycerol transferase